MTGRKELKMDNEFGYGMKYYNDDDSALLRLEALKEAQDLWYETQDWGEEANLNNADDEEMEDFIFEHAREKNPGPNPKRCQNFSLHIKREDFLPFLFPEKFVKKITKNLDEAVPMIVKDFTKNLDEHRLKNIFLDFF